MSSTNFNRLIARMIGVFGVNRGVPQVEVDELEGMGRAWVKEIIREELRVRKGK